MEKSSDGRITSVFLISKYYNWLKYKKTQNKKFTLRYFLELKIQEELDKNNGTR